MKMRQNTNGNACVPAEMDFAGTQLYETTFSKKIANGRYHIFNRIMSTQTIFAFVYEFVCTRQRVYLCISARLFIHDARLTNKITQSGGNNGCDKTSRIYMFTGSYGVHICS